MDWLLQEQFDMGTQCLFTVSNLSVPVFGDCMVTLHVDNDDCYFASGSNIYILPYLFDSFSLK